RVGLFLGDPKGDGPTDDVGVRVKDGEGFFVIRSGAAQGGLAGRLGGTVELAGVPGVGFSGTFSVEINQTTAAVQETLTLAGRTLTLDLPAGKFVKVSGQDVQLTVMGQTLTGDFAFEQLEVTNTRTQAVSKVVRVAVANAGLRLGSPTRDVVVVSGGQGAILLTDAGFVGEFTAAVRIDVPGVTFSGEFGVAINNTANAVTETFQVDEDTVIELVDLPAGSVTVRGADVTLGILGQELTGSFVFRKTAGGEVAVVLANAALSLGDGSREFVHVAIPAGVILVTPGGLAASLVATAEIRNIPDVTLSGAVVLQINNTMQAVSRSFTVEGAPVTLDLPKGPFLRVQGGTPSNRLTLTVGGQLISGVFSFEQTATRSGAKVVRLGLADIDVFFGDAGSDATTTDDQGVRIVKAGYAGALLITPQGMAGELQGTPTFSIPNFSITAELKVQINNLPVAVNETISFVDTDGSTVTDNLVLPAGPYVRVSAFNITVQLSNVSLHGDFFFDQATRQSDGRKVTRVALANVRVEGLGGALKDGTGVLVMLPEGMAGVISGRAEGDFEIGGVPFS
ncbi:MAG: hypothetical protein KDM81_15360, partial [Verrucomicrobiae bacterium]|nr:hypothetical protein [Verrucomicrobiae bacterium]